MPWDANADNAGFSAHDDIWLPIAEQHQSQAVSEQEYTEGSVLNAYKHFIHWRKHQPFCNMVILNSLTCYPVS